MTGCWREEVREGPVPHRLAMASGGTALGLTISFQIGGDTRERLPHAIQTVVVVAQPGLA